MSGQIYCRNCNMFGDHVSSECPAHRAESSFAAPPGLGDGMTLKLAEKLAKNCGYAWDAKGTKDNPINWGDASAFFLEGWLEGMRTAARVCKANAATGNEEGWTDSVSKDCMNLILDGMTPRDESLNDRTEL